MTMTILMVLHFLALNRWIEITSRIVDLKRNEIRHPIAIRLGDEIDPNGLVPLKKKLPVKSPKKEREIGNTQNLQRNNTLGPGPCPEPISYSHYFWSNRVTPGLFQVHLDPSHH